MADTLEKKKYNRINPGLAETLKAAYLKGMRPSLLAAQYGVNIQCIYRRATRDGWHKTLAQDGVNLGERSVEARSQTTRDALASDIEAAAKTLTAIPHTTKLSKAIPREEVLMKLTNRAAKVFGWDNQPSLKVNISLLGQLRDVKTANSSQVVDVQEVKPETEKVISPPDNPTTAST